MKKSLSYIIAVSITVSMLLAACAPAAPVATEVPVVPATEAPAPVVVATEAPAPVPTEAPAPVAPAFCGDAKAGDTITLMYQWSGAEEEKFNTIMKPFVDACGVAVTAESTRDNAILDTRVKSTPPDVLFWPNLAPLTLYPDQLKDLAALGVDTANYSETWLKLGTIDKLVALPIKADIKSIIWYSPAQFEAFGYTVPTTWAELDALVEKMVADGNVPWSMGQESGAATGWTGSDFIQDILLATKDAEYVNNLINGTVAYNDQGVVDAYTIYGKWASSAKYTVGGATGTVSTPFLDAIYKVFQPQPEAMMVKQSGFAGGEIVKQFPDLKYGTDFDFFGIPGAKGLQGGADYMMVFNETAASKALVAYLTSVDGVTNWVTAGFDLSPNKLAAGKYADEQAAKRGEILLNTTGFTPDMGDTIGAPFGEAEWKAIVNVAQGADIKTELDLVAAAQAEALK